MQAYGKRATAVIEWLAELARAQRRRIPVRLVKGAYWDTEIKRAQEQGLAGYPVFTRKVATDVSYLACARALLAEPAALLPDVRDPQRPHARGRAHAGRASAPITSSSACTAWARSSTTR